MSLQDTIREWHRTGIGGSEAAAAIGVSPWLTPLELWAKKVHGEDVKPDGKGPMYWGRAHEPTILREHAMDAGVYVAGRDRDESKVVFTPDGTVESLDSLVGGSVLDGLLNYQRHPKRPWMICLPDGIAVTPYGEPLWIVEAKTSSAYRKKEWGEDGSDEVPDEYRIQCVHNAEVLRESAGLDGMHVRIPALIGGNLWRTYRIGWTPEAAEWITDGEAEFWRHVEEKTPPPTPAELLTPDAVKAAFPRANPEKGVLSLEGDDLSLARIAYEMRERHLEARDSRNDAETRLKALLGEYEEACGPGWRVTWKNTADRTKVDWEAAWEELVALATEKAGVTGEAHEILKRHTKTVPGYRRLNVKKEG